MKIPISQGICEAYVIRMENSTVLANREGVRSFGHYYKADISQS